MTKPTPTVEQMIAQKTAREFARDLMMQYALLDQHAEDYGEDSEETVRQFEHIVEQLNNFSLANRVRPRATKIYRRAKIFHEFAEKVQRMMLISHSIYFSDTGERGKNIDVLFQLSGGFMVADDVLREINSIKSVTIERAKAGA